MHTHACTHTYILTSPSIKSHYIPYICIFTYTHTPQTHVHTCIHTHIRTSYTDACIHTYIRKCIHAYIHIHIYTYISLRACLVAWLIHSLTGWFIRSSEITCSCIPRKCRRGLPSNRYRKASTCLQRGWPSPHMRRMLFCFTCASMHCS